MLHRWKDLFNVFFSKFNSFDVNVVYLLVWPTKTLWKLWFILGSFLNNNDFHSHNNKIMIRFSSSSLSIFCHLFHFEKSYFWKKKKWIQIMSVSQTLSTDTWMKLKASILSPPPSLNDNKVKKKKERFTYSVTSCDMT